MSTGAEPTAIKLPFETGEYLATWDVPNHLGGELEIPGLLTLEQGKYPTGILHGAVRTAAAWLPFLSAMTSRPSRDASRVAPTSPS